MISKLPVYFCFLLIFDIWPSLQLLCPLLQITSLTLPTYGFFPTKARRGLGGVTGSSYPPFGAILLFTFGPLGCWPGVPGYSGLTLTSFDIFWLWHGWSLMTWDAGVDSGSFRVDAKHVERLWSNITLDSGCPPISNKQILVSQDRVLKIWRFPKMGVPPNGWFLRENPI